MMLLPRRGCTLHEYDAFNGHPPQGVRVMATQPPPGDPVSVPVDDPVPTPVDPPIVTPSDPPGTPSQPPEPGTDPLHVGP
jgi:hypothetical protein